MLRTCTCTWVSQWASTKAKPTGSWRHAVDSLRCSRNDAVSPPSIHNNTFLSSLTRSVFTPHAPNVVNSKNRNELHKSITNWPFTWPTVNWPLTQPPLLHYATFAITAQQYAPRASVQTAKRVAVWPAANWLTRFPNCSTNGHTVWPLGALAALLAGGWLVRARNARRNATVGRLGPARGFELHGK